MIHPRELLRTNSEENSYFTAPINVSQRNNIDCGWSVLPCLNDRLNLEKFANAGIFLFVLALLGFHEGAALSYFRGTSNIWSEQYGFDNNLTGESQEHFLGF